METISYFGPLLSSSLLVLLSLSLHGPVQTESTVVEGFSGSLMYFFTRFTKIANTIVVIAIALILTVFGVNLFLPGLRGLMDGLIGPYVAWLWYAPAFNVGSAVVVWLSFWIHNLRNFHSLRPDYQNWPKWDDSSSRPTNTTVVVINNQSWSPFAQDDKPSLQARASNRTSSKARASTRTSSVVPMPFFVSAPTRSSKTSRASTRTSSKSSSSSGDLSGLGGLGLIAVAVLLVAAYGYGSWLVCDKIMDFWDEVFVAREYAPAD